MTTVCTEIARTYARSAISPVVMPDATCHSLFPLQSAGLRRADECRRVERDRPSVIASCSF